MSVGTGSFRMMVTCPTWAGLPTKKMLKRCFPIHLKHVAVVSQKGHQSNRSRTFFNVKIEIFDDNVLISHKNKSQSNIKRNCTFKCGFYLSKYTHLFVRSSLILCDSTSVVGLSTARSAYQRYLAPVTLLFSLMDLSDEIRLH